MYTYSDNKTDSSTSHIWLIMLIVLLVIILVTGIVVWFNRKYIKSILK